MNSRPLPSPSEWQVFACLCRFGPSTLIELELRLPRLKRPIETLLLRLADKGYASPRDLAGRFCSLIPFAEALEAQIDRFIEGFIAGDREACAQLRKLRSTGRKSRADRFLIVLKGCRVLQP